MSHLISTHFYAVTNDEAEITMCLRAILRICGIPLITADVLKEAWPNESFQTRTPAEDHVNVPHDRARSLSASDYQLTVWYAVVSRLLEDPEDDEPLKWFATIGPAGPPATDRMKLESFLLRHPSVFNFHFVPIHVTTDEQTPLLSLLPQSGASSANDQEKAAIATVIEHVKTTLGRLSPFPDERLSTLVKIITLSGDRLADLSGFDLSAAQITSFISQCPKIDALDISQNAQVVLHDIPAILATAPHLLRLNVSGCSAIDGRALLELVRTQPSLFRTVEAIIHPAFLTIAKPPDFPVSFTFMFADRQDMNGVALPLYTPTQVLQALCLLLPLAWRSSESLFAADPGLFTHSESADDNAAPGGDTPDHEDSSNGHGGIGAGQTNAWKWVLNAHDRLNIPGSLAMSSPMLVYSAFSSGSRREDQSWSDRAVVGVPLHPYPVVSASPEGSWAFFLDWSTPEIGVQKWAFIRYAPDADGEEGQGQGPTPGERPDAMVEGAVTELAELSLDEKPPEVDPTSEPRNKRRGAVYDLRGFLRCMVEEGRPSPPEELVARLEVVLYSRHQFNGAIVCPLMQDEDVPTALTVIPAVAVGDVNGDIRTRRRYTLASEVHPLARFESGRRAGQY